MAIDHTHDFFNQTTYPLVTPQAGDVSILGRAGMPHTWTIGGMASAGLDYVANSINVAPVAKTSGTPSPGETYIGPAHTGLTPAEWVSIYESFANTVQFLAGNILLQRARRIVAPAYASTGAPPGALTNNPAYSVDVPAAIGSGFSLLFAAINPPQCVVASSATPPTNVFSVSAFIKPSAVDGDGYGAILASVNARAVGTALGNGLYLRQIGANYYLCYTQNGIDVVSTTAIALNVWTHVGLTCDGRTLTFYVNGVAAGVITPDPVTIGTPNPLQFSLVGCDGGAATSRFIGRIDETRVYLKTVLLNTDMVALSAGNLVVGTPDVYYKFNEGSGLVALNAGRSIITEAETVEVSDAPIMGTNVQIVDAYSQVFRNKVRISAGGLLMDIAPPLTPRRGLISLGSGGFGEQAGGGSGNFNGNPAGTHLAINSASNFAGNMIDVQRGGVSKFTANATGVGFGTSNPLAKSHTLQENMGLEIYRLQSGRSAWTPMQQKFLNQCFTLNATAVPLHTINTTNNTTTLFEALVMAKCISTNGGDAVGVSGVWKVSVRADTDGAGVVTRGAVKTISSDLSAGAATWTVSFNSLQNNNLSLTVAGDAFSGISWQLVDAKISTLGQGTVLALDFFKDTNGVNLAAHAMDVGTGWTMVPNGLGSAPGAAGNYTIQFNSARAEIVGSPAPTDWATTDLGAAMGNGVEITLIGTRNSGDPVIILGYIDQNNWLCAFLNQDAPAPPNGGTFAFAWMNNGSESEDTLSPLGTTTGAFQMKASRRGKFITITVNGLSKTWDISVAVGLDFYNKIAASTKCGFGGNKDNANFMYGFMAVTAP